MIRAACNVGAVGVVYGIRAVTAQKEVRLRFSICAVTSQFAWEAPQA